MATPLRLVMLGTGTFAEPVLDALLKTKHHVVGLVTQPDREVTRHSASTRQIGRGMKAIAESAGVSVYQPESINTPDGVAQLRTWQPDLLVTAAYGQILKADVLESSRLGGINEHGSLLPKYRGAAPVAWAIWRGETETGVTIIRMTTGLDAGAMLAREATPIGAEETAGEVEARLAQIGAKLAVDVIDRLAAGPVEGQLQDPAGVTKAPKLTKEHGNIDWTRPAVEIARQVRALQPWPTAYTFLHRAESAPQRLIILKARAIDETFGPPGAIRVISNELDVAAGSGALRILELQPSAKKRMTAEAFLRGRPMREGDLFGPAD